MCTQRETASLYLVMCKMNVLFTSSCDCRHYTFIVASSHSFFSGLYKDIKRPPFNHPPLTTPVITAPLNWAQRGNLWALQHTHPHTHIVICELKMEVKIIKTPAECDLGHLPRTPAGAHHQWHYKMMLLSYNDWYQRSLELIGIDDTEKQSNAQCVFSVWERERILC